MTHPAPPLAGDADRLAALGGCCIWGTPVALVSLVAGDRQGFKAWVDIPPCETALDSAVGAHAPTQPDRLLVVPDLTADVRTGGQPAGHGRAPHPLRRRRPARHPGRPDRRAGRRPAGTRPPVPSAVVGRTLRQVIPGVEAGKPRRDPHVFTDLDRRGSTAGMKLAPSLRDRWPPIELLVTSPQPWKEEEVPHRDVLPGRPFDRHRIVAALRRFAA